MQQLHQLRAMTRYSAVGTPRQVQDYLDEFAGHADADELIVVHQSPSIEARLGSVELVAGVSGEVVG
jgi:alkanesulfonate monooxygenase SsuD/methylene tetrahydromethanopterin reductase-like flavin-dependent oxidoreductase (luciferase family)